MNTIVARASVEGPAERLQDFMQRHIPITTAMQLQVVKADRAAVTITAPLQPNVNDKGTAFGGSMASVATLAGWGLVWANLNDEDGYDIMIRDTQLRYRRPVYGQIEANASIEADAWRDFMDKLSARGRARIEIGITIAGEDGPAMDMVGTYVARRRAD
ncbi:MAG: thioesterase [Lysobacteraceae bacterium]|nr:MAG: thioesterase [Xanthomonadaceae bacterium]